MCIPLELAHFTYSYICTADLEVLVDDCKKSSDFNHVGVETTPDFSPIDSTIDTLLPECKDNGKFASIESTVTRR